MGLLDFSFLSSPDPNVQAQTALAAGLLGGTGSFNQNLGRSLLAGQVAGARAGEIQRQSELDKLQVQRLQLALQEEARKQKQFNDLENFRQSIGAPNFGPPTVDNAQNPDANVQRLMYGALKAGALNPLDYIKTLQRDTTPIKLGADETLLNPKTYAPIVTGRPKQPSAVQEYEYAKAQGYPGTFNEWSTEQKRAGASNTNVKIENALGSGLAGQVGPLATASYQQATGAIQQKETSDRIIKAVDSGKMIAGPMSNWSLIGLQIGQMLGIGGKDAAETILNTRAAIQGLAQATVAARGALKGQGQVSDYEGRLLQKAASGDINEMTAAEIKQVAVVNKRLSQQLIDQHKQFIGKIRADKNPEISGLAQFFDINTPQETVDWNSLGRNPAGR